MGAGRKLLRGLDQQAMARAKISQLTGVPLAKTRLPSGKSRLVDNSHVPHELKMKAKKAARRLNSLKQADLFNGERVYSEAEMKLVADQLDDMAKAKQPVATAVPSLRRI